MLGQTEVSQEVTHRWVFRVISLVMQVVWVVALAKFFQLANDVRSLRILLADSEAREENAS